MSKIGVLENLVGEVDLDQLKLEALIVVVD